MSRGIPLLVCLRAVVARRVVPPLVAALLLPAGGCLSTKVRVGPTEATNSAGVLVRVCTDERAARQGRADAPATLVELYRIEPGDAELFLQRSLSHEWGVAELPPGRYRLRVLATVDEGGNVHPTRTGDREATFTLAPGETAEATVILKKTPTGLIVAAGLTVVVLVVALAVLGSRGDLPPPQAATDLILGAARAFPPPPRLDHVVLAADLRGPWIPGEYVEEERPAPPRVTSTSPEHGAMVAARRVAPTLTLSQPLDEAGLHLDTIVMLGSKSGLVPGRTVMRDGLLRFEPAVDLAPGEDVIVTLRAQGVVNPAGRHLAQDFSWGFRVAP